MNSGKPRKSCIYCGGEVRGVKKGEHIIPEAIGGVPTIKNVCKTCNNGVLSDLDRELCSRSPVSIIAAQVMDAYVAQIWDVDHNDGHLLLEAKSDFSGRSPTQYPQIVFESTGPTMRGDREQLDRFGKERFPRVFERFMLEAFVAYGAGRKRRIIFEQIERNSDILDRYRYPPRIFARRSIEDFDSKMTFVIRYLDRLDREFALSQLANWDTTKPFWRFETGMGSDLPAIRCYWDAKKVLRALAKLAVNMLADRCQNTPVDRYNFADVIRPILGEEELNPEILACNGFVWPSDLADIAADNDGHSFRLQYDDGQWFVYSSFFGGRICSVARIPGPNRESWRRADIVAPLHSDDWIVSTGNILQPLRTHVEWQDASRIIPSAEILNMKTEVNLQSCS